MCTNKIPQHLEDFKEEYKLPEFWIAKYLRSEEPLLSPEEISLLNKKIRQRSLVWDPLLLERCTEGKIKAKITEVSSPINEAWFLDGKMMDEQIKRQLWKNCGIEEVREFRGELYGVTVARTSVRALPTHSILSEGKEDLEFDLLQLTTIDPITPLAVLHFSRDGEWAFCQSPVYYGWVPVKDIALERNRLVLSSFFQESKFAVVIANRFTVSLGQRNVAFQMGTSLPYRWSDGKNLFVQVPIKLDDGRLSWSEVIIHDYDHKVSKEYLPYTLKNIYSQAFKMLGEPYAWGGSRLGVPGRDCSRFTQDIFKVFGILLPRDSGPQCGCMKTVVKFSKSMLYGERYVSLQQTSERPLLLCMPGHIMLYLGEDAGNLYAIHSLWAYSHPGISSAQDEVEIVNKVVVTSLKIGYASKKGSFLERLESVKSIALQ